MRLLVAEDEKDIAKALVMLLQKNNYCADSVNNGTDALEYILTGNYDGVILDIMMPGMNGIEVLKRLREKGIDIPVLMLTAKGELDDKVEGLDAGADDYLAKPFAVPELMARVRAMLRRRTDFKPDIFEVKEVKLDRSTMEIMYGSKKTKLGTREFQVMEELMENYGRIVTADHFMEHIWGWDSDVEVGIIWVIISSLRKKLTELGAPISIKNIRGAGYTLEEQNDK